MPKACCATAMADDDPVIYLEHKHITAKRSPVPEEDYSIPLGSAKVTRRGGDVTIVSYSASAGRALQAADGLAEEGIEATVIDLRSLVPLDMDTVLEHAAATGRVLVAHEAWRFGGFGAEIAAQISEELFGELRAPVARIGAEQAPIPFSPTPRGGSRAGCGTASPTRSTSWSPSSRPARAARRRRRWPPARRAGAPAQARCRDTPTPVRHAAHRQAARRNRQDRIQGRQGRPRSAH